MNLSFLTCKLLQGNKIASDHQNNIVVEFFKGDIIFDGHIKTHNGLEAGVKFLHETSQERAQSANAYKKKNINVLHVELGHPLEVISHATAKSMIIQVTGTFKPCDDYTLGKTKKGRVCKNVVAHSKILDERLFLILVCLLLPPLESRSIGYLS